MTSNNFSSTDFYTPTTNFPLPSEGLKSYRERELNFLNLQHADFSSNPDAPLFIPTDTYVPDADTHFIWVDTTNNTFSFTNYKAKDVPFENRACFSLVLLHPSDSSQSLKFTPIFDSRFWNCTHSHKLPKKQFTNSIRRTLFSYLLSTVMHSDFKFNKCESDFLLSTAATYHSGVNKRASSKYKTSDAIKRKIATKFVKASIFPHFPLNWDPVNFPHINHQVIRPGSLLNLSYQQYPTPFSLWTIDAAVNDFCTQYDHHKKGFCAVLPLNKGFERIHWKQNGTFKFHPKDFSSFPSWLQKLEKHPEVALVLLDKKVSFERAINQQAGATVTEKTGPANFGTLLAFFGFQTARISAKMYWDSDQKLMDFANDD